MGDSLESNIEPNIESQSSNIIDFTSFLNYLRKAVCILHPEDDTVPPAFNLALEDKVNQEYIRKFLNDPQVWALCIQRSSNKGLMCTDLKKFSY